MLSKKMFRKYLRVLFFFLAVILVFGCNKSLRNRADILKYINDEDNGLNKGYVSNEIECKAIFLPWQVQVYDKKNSISFDRKTLRRYQSKYYFLISFSKGNKELLKQLSFTEYSELVQVLSFRMNDYIIAKLDNGKVIEPLSCIFQQMYGFSNANELLVVFEKGMLERASTIEIHIKEFGLQVGHLSFKFKKDNVIKLQNLIQS